MEMERGGRETRGRGRARRRKALSSFGAATDVLFLLSIVSFFSLSTFSPAKKSRIEIRRRLRRGRKGHAKRLRRRLKGRVRTKNVRQRSPRRES